METAQKNRLLFLLWNTESMDDYTKRYFEQTIPKMTEEQKQKFLGILEEERRQLDKIEENYNKSISYARIW